MGSKKTITTNKAEHAVTTPQVAAWMNPTLQGYVGQIGNFMQRDPYSLVAGPSDLQKAAFKSALGLGGPMGWRGALQNGLAGGLQGLGAGLQEQSGVAPAQPQSNPLAMVPQVPQVPQVQQAPGNVTAGVNPYLYNLPPLF